MSQPPVLNGPSPENVPFKDAQPTQETAKSQQDGQQFPGYVTASPRPPLTRLDSRSSFPLRPGFPPQPGLGVRPQQLRQPIPGQQFVQRPPGATPRPTGQPFVQNPGVRQINPNYRPPIAFPRPPLPRQPGIFQQRSVPGYTQPRPFEDQLLRSQTLDSTDLTKLQDDSARSAVNALKNRTLSLSSNASENQNYDEERRRSISSVGSVGSIENLDKKVEGDYPSRPESRASSRMNRIVEDEDKDRKTEKSPQKNVEFKLPVEVTKSKSPSPVPKTADKADIVPPKLVEQTDPVLNKIADKTDTLPTKIVDNNRDKAPTKMENDATRTVQNCFDSKIEAKPAVKNLELKNLKKNKSPSKPEGDNDSGVDESTQGNDQSSNGDQSSPRKSSGKIVSRQSSTTPTKNRSLSRGSKSPSLKSPDSTASTPGTTEKKKVPMNRIQVGSAPSPNLKVVRSKIGSLENASYKPGGGNIKIESKKLDFKNASARIEAKNDKYAPKGGDKKIQQQKLQWNAKSKIGSLENATHKPKGGEKKIESIKLDFKDKAKPKVGSKDNIKHVPGGGDIKIENKKLDLKVQSKIGSLDNVKHRPGGGEKRIFDDKDYLKQMSAISSENHSLSGSQNSLPSQPEAGGPVADENLNQER